MKFTKDQLKRIISEELSALSEVDNNQVAVQTAQYMASKAMSAQDQSNYINNSGNGDILEQIHGIAQDMNNLILGLDPGIRGALAEMVTNVLAEADRLMVDQP